MNIKDSFKERLSKVSTPKKSKWIEEMEKNNVESISRRHSQMFSQPSFASSMSAGSTTGGETYQTVFGGLSSGIMSSGPLQSGQISSNPRLYAPFQLLDELDKAKLIKEFLISRGIKKVSKEIAKALFLINEELVKEGNEGLALPIQKQAKKKLAI